MLFSRARNTVSNGLHITTLNVQSILRVSQYKYLIIWLDHKLTFKFHIDPLAK